MGNCCQCCVRQCKGFRDFIVQGNVIDIAVGLMIAAAFKDVVDALTQDLLTPLIGAAGRLPDFSGASFTVRGSVFKYGHFINACIAFLILAAVIYFCIVVPLGLLTARSKKRKAEEDAALHRACPFCMEQLLKEADRCKFCCKDVPPVPSEPPVKQAVPVKAEQSPEEAKMSGEGAVKESGSGIVN